MFARTEARVLGMELTFQERAVLNRFRSGGPPTLRFAQAGSRYERAKAAVVDSLIRKGILARLGRNGEYWLTDRGARLLAMGE